MTWSSPIAHAVGPGGSGGSTTSAIDTTGADFIVVGALYSQANHPTISDSKSNTWTAVGSAHDSSQEGVQLYFCQNPTVGSGHTFSALASSSFASPFVIAFSGSDTSPLDQQTGNQSAIASTSIASGSITPTTDNQLIIVMYGNEGTAVSQAMDSGMTLVDTLGISGPTWGGSIGYKIQTSAAAINVTGSTAASGTNSIQIASFRIPAPADNGTIAVTEDNDTFAATGTVGSGSHAALLEDNDTLAATGSLGRLGHITVTETNDAFVGHGIVPRTAHAAITERNDTFAGHGGVGVAIPSGDKKFTAAPADSFISRAANPDFIGKQNGVTIKGQDGKHYTTDFGEPGVVIICAETGAVQYITGAQFSTDKTSHGLDGTGFFVPAYGCIGVPNTNHFFVWSQDGNWLFSLPSKITFLRYVINESGVPEPDGGSTFVVPAGLGRKMAMTTFGGNGTVWAANVVDDQVYMCWESSIDPGIGFPCMTCIPYSAVYDSSLRDWLAHTIDLTSNFGQYYWNEHTRAGESHVYDYNNLACVVDNGDTTGSVISYFGTADISGSPNPTVNAFAAPCFKAFDVKFTPSGLGGSWSIGGLYNISVTGIGFPFSDENKDKFGGDGFDADDYYSPNVLLIGGQTYFCVARPYATASQWSPSGIGERALLFKYTKGSMAYTGGVFDNNPFDPSADWGGPDNLGWATLQAFVAGPKDKEIWGFASYNNDAVYYKLFFTSLPEQGLRFSLLRDPGYVDWASTGAPADFLSFLDTWWMMPKGSAVFAQAPWVIAYISQHDQNPDPSLFLTPRWEWTDSTINHKSGPVSQAYHNRPRSDVGDFRVRVRGKGRALQLHWSSETGKPFNLLGWSVDAQNNSEP